MSLFSSAYASDALQAFPPAEPGMNRYIINLPKIKDEELNKVELIIGKNVKTDSVNNYFFGGKLDVVNISGWGYDRYVVKELGPMAGTLMGVDPNSKQVERFVTLRGEPRLFRYNSRLPMVVYVPEGVEVRYRLWRTIPKAEKARQG
jgi:ecotin